MTETENTFLLAGDKFMPKIYLKQFVFTCSGCGHSIKTKK